MNKQSYNIYVYEGLGNLLEFAESQGWSEPGNSGKICECVLPTANPISCPIHGNSEERIDAADCLEADAIDYLTEKGWEISLDME